MNMNQPTSDGIKSNSVSTHDASKDTELAGNGATKTVINEVDRLKLQLVDEKLKRNEAQSNLLQIEHVRLREQRNKLMADLMNRYDIKIGDRIDSETGEIITTAPRV